MKNNLVLLLMLSALVCFASSCKNDADELEPTQVVNGGDKDSSTDKEEEKKEEEKKEEKEEEKEEAKEDTTETIVVDIEGAISAASYRVSDARRVYFSRGNLQFNAVQGSHAVLDGTSEVAGTWRFAENQYDYIGEDNKNISSTYDGWIDLFGWGTSGWNSGARAYQPWAASTSYSDYYVGGSSSNSMLDTKADWGVYNAISNGGNEPNKWRTLTLLEWQYLFKNNKWTLGYIKDGDDSHLCFMLIPETFVAPEGTTVTVLSTSTTSTSMSVSVPSTNTYTAEQFASLEKLGVVALPCAGWRVGTESELEGFGEFGVYWSSSVKNLGMAYAFYFDFSTTVKTDHYNDVNYGRSVRLVQDL